MNSHSGLIAVLVFLVASPAMAGGSREPDADLNQSQPQIPPDRDRLGWAVPDYVRLQTGGFSGMFAAGIGYSAFRDIVNVGIGYGYVPPRGSAPEVHLATTTAQLRPLRAMLGDGDRYYYYPLYAGAGCEAGFGPNLFLKQPARYPSGYYAPTGLHYLLLVGTEVAVRMREGSSFLRHGVYAELVTIDQYFDALIQNRRTSFANAFASALGYRASF